jgi:hypothetical protein
MKTALGNFILGKEFEPLIILFWEISTGESALFSF